jgi:VWFA-related protein
MSLSGAFRMHLRHSQCLLLGAAAFALCMATRLWAQTPGPDEIRVSSRPYVSAQNSIKVQSNLVEVDVVVRDAHGKPVAGLAQANFEIYDDGKVRAIAAFSVETLAKSAGGSNPSASSSIGTTAGPAAAAVPRFIALFFDDVNTNSGDLAHAKLAAIRFVKEALTPTDRVAIFTASSTESLAFTDDASKLTGTIEKLQAHPRMSESGLGTCPRITPYQAYLIANNSDPLALQAAHDEANACGGRSAAKFADDVTTAGTVAASDPAMVAIRAQAEQTWDQAKFISQNTLASIRGVVEYLAKMPGNRTLLLASSGFLSGTLERDQDTIISEAAHTSVVINALDAKGLYSEAPARPLNEPLPMGELPVSTFIFETASLGDGVQQANAAMASFAASTGGLFFHNNNDLDFGFRELGMIPEVTYLLGFSPDAVLPDGKYHKLRVKLIAADYPYVQARPGYVAPTKEEAEKPALESKLDQEVFANDDLTEVPVGTLTQPGKSESGEPILWVVVKIDVKHLQFDRHKDRQDQKLSFVMALFDKQGNFVTGKEGEMNFALKPVTFDHFAHTGLSAKIFLPAPLGSYRLRTVTQEATDGKMSASTISVEIR